jgi:hypothetical protein
VAGEGAGAPTEGVPVVAGDGVGVPGVPSDEQPTLAEREEPAPAAGEGRSVPGEHCDDEGVPEAPVSMVNMAIGDFGVTNVAIGDASVGVPEAPRADRSAP